MTTARILVVEDDPDLREFLLRVLPFYGDFQVVAAHDGVAGLEAYYDQRPDCLVIDVRMPEMDGYQLVRALRGDPDSLGTPLIILTALAQDRDVFVGYASGADRYLQKPVKPKELAEAIREAITLSDAERMRSYEQLATQEDGHDE